MNLEIIQYRNVSPLGTLPNDNTIITKGGFFISDENTNRISFFTPRNVYGVVYKIKFKFNHKYEMRLFLYKNNLDGYSTDYIIKLEDFKLDLNRCTYGDKLLTRDSKIIFYKCITTQSSHSLYSHIIMYNNGAESSRTNEGASFINNITGTDIIFVLI